MFNLDAFSGNQSICQNYPFWTTLFYVSTILTLAGEKGHVAVTAKVERILGPRDGLSESINPSSFKNSTNVLWVRMRSGIEVRFLQSTSGAKAVWGPMLSAQPKDPGITRKKLSLQLMGIFCLLMEICTIAFGITDAADRQTSLRHRSQSAQLYVSLNLNISIRLFSCRSWWAMFFYFCFSNQILSFEGYALAWSREMGKKLSPLQGFVFGPNMWGIFAWGK